MQDLEQSLQSLLEKVPAKWRAHQLAMEEAPDAESAIRLAAEAYAPEEVCGVLLNDPRTQCGLRFEPWPNVHPEPQRHFRMSSKALLYNEGRLRAVVHSHIHPQPHEFSEWDRRTQAAMAVPWLLVHVGADGKATAPFKWLGRRERGAGDAA